MGLTYSPRESDTPNCRYRRCVPSPNIPLDIRNLDVGRVRRDYDTVWRLQRRLHGQVAEGSAAPVVLLVEHAGVFTAGSRTQLSDLPTDGSEVIRVDRGGRITWHGPGQLVCYPILPLAHPFDVTAHVRRLEQVAIETCDSFGVNVARIQGRSGVWITPGKNRPAKIAAVGVRVARGVTMHGMALNVDCDLDWSQRIVACGLSDADVTSLQVELDRPVSITDVLPAFVKSVKSVFGATVAALPDAGQTWTSPESAGVAP